MTSQMLQEQNIEILINGFEMEKEREIQVEQITVHGKDCIGCEKSKKDIMISYTDKDGDIIDLFLSQKKAEELYKELDKRIFFNKGGNLKSYLRKNKLERVIEQ
jgi:hypothetical protein